MNPTWQPTPEWPTVTGSPLDAAAAAGVRSLAAAAAQDDGVDALSEHSLTHLDRPGSTHVLAGPLPDPVGYLQVWADGSGELVVAPGGRRRGVGRRLVEAAREASDLARLWAHGTLPAAEAFAGAFGLSSSRTLLKLSRPLRADETFTGLPEGYAARPFERGRDETAWLATNAAAFADHPEQGRVGPAELEILVNQPWFDAAGFLVVTPQDAPDDVVAFHWTKVDRDQPSTGAAGSGDTGEVFVVGIRPDHQGRGLGTPLTALGLRHLAERGVRTVELYVDGDNHRARHTYAALGFTQALVDTVFEWPLPQD